MKTLQEISGGFHAAYNEQERRRDIIKAEAEKMKEQAKRYQRIAAQKMGEYYKLYDKASAERKIGWTDGLLRPLLDEIEQRTGWEFDDKDDLRTFGLRAECPVFVNGDGTDEHGYRNAKAYITFTPHNKHNDDDTWSWELYFDTGEYVDSYPSGSIGALNGFGKKAAKVESVEQVIEFLRKQMCCET